mmetsp:Transcript_31794/g.49743  ORF Transcript_31794/g.49743 Transcript_31794/m.49743 type:complete len:89 (-) Transcript_31794:380-646(-)
MREDFEFLANQYPNLKKKMNEVVYKRVQKVSETHFGSSGTLSEGQEGDSTSGASSPLSAGRSSPLGGARGWEPQGVSGRGRTSPLAVR